MPHLFALSKLGHILRCITFHILKWPTKVFREINVYVSLAVLRPDERGEDGAD